MPLMKLRLAKPRYLIDLNRIADLNYIRPEGDAIRIGALTTHAELEDSKLLKDLCPLLSQTAATIGDIQVRNQGTLGGSLAHADPAGDMPATILALGGEMKAIGPSGERWIKAEEFFLGLLMTSLEPDEILAEVKVPVLSDNRTAYLKAAQRASGFAVVGIAACLKLGQNGICQDIAVGVTGVSDKAYRAESVERILKGKRLETKLVEEAAAEVTRGVDLFEDINGSKEYRSHLARVYATRAILAAAKI